MVDLAFVQCSIRACCVSLCAGGARGRVDVRVCMCVPLLGEKINRRRKERERERNPSGLTGFNLKDGGVLCVVRTQEKEREK